MTDTEKLKLIKTLINDIYECTVAEAPAFEALVVCIDAVADFGDDTKAE